MARGTIITKTLGKIEQTDHGRHTVRIQGKPPKEFATKAAAERFLSKNGPKRYLTVIRLNGRQKWKTFTKKSDADMWLARNSTDVMEGTYRPLKKATFEKYVEGWKDKNLVKLKPSTVNGYCSALSKHLVPEFGPRQMTSIDPEDITRLESAMLRKGLSAKHTRNVLQVLSRVLNDAVIDGYVRVSPMARLKLVQIVERESRALSQAEAQALLGACEGEIRLVILIGLLAGLRRNELFALRWEHIDFDNDVIQVRQNLFWRYGQYQKVPEGEEVFTFTTPKSRHSNRDVDLSPALKDALWSRYMEMKMEGKTGLIFQTSNGKPYDPKNVCERNFKPAVARARKKALEEAQKQALKDGRTFNESDFTFLEGVTPHTLRHTFGSWKIDQGEDIVYVSRQLGHANVSITANVYSHLLRARRPEAAAKTDVLLFG